jgi:hypothetical protein
VAFNISAVPLRSYEGERIFPRVDARMDTIP